MAVKDETLTTVETKIKEMQETGGINLPANYSASNALQKRVANPTGDRR